MLHGCREGKSVCAVGTAMAKNRWFEAATDLSGEGRNSLSVRKTYRNTVELERILFWGNRKATGFAGSSSQEVEGVGWTGFAA